MPIDWLEKLRYYLQTLAFCLAVSAIQYAFQPSKPYELPLVYSLCIGSFTWALIDLGRHLFPSSAETGWPQGLGGVLLPLGGIAGGYVLGTLAGDAWFGWSSWDTHPAARAQLPVSIIVTSLAGVAGTWYFYSKNKAAYLEGKMLQASEVAAQAKRHAAESTLKLLQAQIEPHMLFNTLANLRVLVTTDPARAQLMLDHLISYLRATLSASRASTTSAHSLSTEFERLRDYLELMAIRMGPRLTYTLDLPLELTHHPVPPLLLQPLVENSIKHGLEPQVDGGCIVVRAHQADNTLWLEVSDTGAGLPSPLAPVENNVSQGGFGVTQVKDRLTALYGGAATFAIGANTPRGTAVRISIPLAP